MLVHSAGLLSFFILIFSVVFLLRFPPYSPDHDREIFVKYSKYRIGDRIILSFWACQNSGPQMTTLIEPPIMVNTLFRRHLLNQTPIQTRLQILVIFTFIENIILHRWFVWTWLERENEQTIFNIEFKLELELMLNS